MNFSFQTKFQFSPNSLFSSIGVEFPPIKKDAWSLIFPPEMGISERFEVKAERPHQQNEVKEVKYKNSYTKYKGPTKFMNMTLEFRDVIGPNVFSKLISWQIQHYNPVSGCGGYPAQYKKNLTLVMEDDCGNAVQQFIYYGCFIADLNGGQLDMESPGDIANVTIEVAYDSYLQNF